MSHNGVFVLGSWSTFLYDVVFHSFQVRVFLINILKQSTFRLIEGFFNVLFTLSQSFTALISVVTQCFTLMHLFDSVYIIIII